MPTLTHSERKIGLDLPRAVAIALVLVSHFAHRFEILGFYGVEMFFALSGFLIGGILYRDLIAPEWSFPHVKSFWLRRWWRTLPNYYLFLLISVAFHAVYGGLPPFGDFLRYLAFTQTLLRGNDFFFGVSWSLCIEEFFYLLFPLVLLLLVASGISKRNAFLLATVAFLLVPAWLREMLLRAHSPHEVRMMTLARLDSIFYGVAMAFCVNRFQMTPASRRWLLGLGIALVFIAIVLQSERASTAVYRICFFILPGGFALMLPWLETVKRFPGRLTWLAGGAQRLSLWSYSLYLCHIPILFTVYAAFGDWRENTLVNLFAKIVGLIASLAVARMLYVHFEKPLTNLRPPESRPSRNFSGRTLPPLLPG